MRGGHQKDDSSSRKKRTEVTPPKQSVHQLTGSNGFLLEYITAQREIIARVPTRGESHDPEEWILLKERIELIGTVCSTIFDYLAKMLLEMLIKNLSWFPRGEKILRMA